MIWAETAAWFVILTHSLMEIDSSRAIEGQTTMKTVTIPANLFCRIHTFEAPSRIECTAKCLIWEDFGSYTAITFDEGQQVCSCGKANCFETTLGINDVAPTNVLVNSRCDRLEEGIYVSCNIKTYSYII